VMGLAPDFLEGIFVVDIGVERLRCAAITD
jgi:hypothetical protein